MPLETQVFRNNVPRKDIVWDFFTLSCMYTVAIKEAAPEYEYQEGKKFGDLEDGEWIDFSMAPIYYLDIPKCPLVKRGEQTLLETHTFDRGEGKSLIFLPGDRLTAYRSSSSRYDYDGDE
jgi:hypothetical protein